MPGLGYGLTQDLRAYSNQNDSMEYTWRSRTHLPPAHLCSYTQNHLIQQGINRISFTPYSPPSWTFLSVLPRGCFPLTKTNSGHQLLIMITEPHLHWLRSFCPYELQPMGNHFSCISKSNSAFGHLQSHQESAHSPHPAASTTLPVLSAGDCESRCR